MTNEQIENAFNEAQERWHAENKGTPHYDSQQRYFFSAGSEFGLASAKEIYNESHGEERQIP
jgi:hypothetical protein